MEDSKANAIRTSKPVSVCLDNARKGRTGNIAFLQMEMSPLNCIKNTPVR